MQSCLVIKTSSLGDILQTLPQVLALKKQYPQMQIDWVVEKKWAKTLRAFKGIDHLIECDFKSWKQHPLKNIQAIKTFITTLREKKYDLVIDFQANTKSGLIMSLARGLSKRSFCFNQVAEWPHRLFKATRIHVPTDHYSYFYHGLVADLIKDDLSVMPQLKTRASIPDLPQDKKIIMLGLGSMWPSKRLSFLQIQTLLKEQSLKEPSFFLIPATPQETPLYTQALEGYAGLILTKPELIEYVPYLKETELFIGVDSALLHLARLFHVASIAFFGPSSSKFYGQTQDIQGSCPYNQTFIKRCPRLKVCAAPCLKNLPTHL